MRPRDHVIYGSIGAVALYPFMGKETAFFWAASVAIDIDHYIDYIWRNRLSDLSLRGMFEYHRHITKKWHDPAFLNIEIFHTVEFVLPLFVVAHWTASAMLFAACLGLVFHMALDLLSLYKNGIFFARAHSLPEYFIRKTMLQRRGLDPDGLYREAARKTIEGEDAHAR